MAQILKGETFGDSGAAADVTSTRMNNHVDAATLLPGAIGDQTDILTAVAADDVLLLGDTSTSGTLKKVQAQNLLVPESISAKGDIGTAIAAADLLLMADASASNAIKKVEAQNLLPPEIITVKTDISTAIAAGDLFLFADVSASNALLKVQAQNLLPPEVITAKTALTTTDKDDLVLVSDSNASNALKKVALENLLPTFTSTVTAMNGLAAGTNLNQAHGLGAIVPKFVRGVLVCTTVDLGYTVGDEVDFQGTTGGGLNPPSLTVGASTSNVWATQDIASSSIQVKNKSTGGFGAITQTSWSMKIYARP